ncbi:MAG: hypothetical protein HYR85_28200 [Planctomycetes bacterium]|nr:hypothetical protein [Planctomycetota bacterium]MBI3846256.1 hypothetical protein [Planctomycetota bacterium]
MKTNAIRKRGRIRGRLGRSSPLDPIVIFPAAALVLGFVLGAIHGSGAPSAEYNVDRLSLALRLGVTWAATFGVGGACIGIFLASALVLVGKTFERPQVFAAVAAVSIFLVLLEGGILAYGHAVTECFAFPQILGVFGILLFGYAVALGGYLVTVTWLRSRMRAALLAPRRAWFLPDAPSLN